jgi:hypothetical protein
VTCADQNGNAALNPQYLVDGSDQTAMTFTASGSQAASFTRMTCTVDLGAAYYLGAIREYLGDYGVQRPVVFGADQCVDAGVLNLSLDVSVDGVTWTSLNSSNGAQSELDVSPDATERYVRTTATACWPSPPPGIYTLSAFQAPNPDLTTNNVAVLDATSTSLKQVCNGAIPGYKQVVGAGTAGFLEIGGVDDTNGAVSSVNWNCQDTTVTPYVGSSAVAPSGTLAVLANSADPDCSYLEPIPAPTTPTGTCFTDVDSVTFSSDSTKMISAGPDPNTGDETLTERSVATDGSVTSSMSASLPGNTTVSSLMLTADGAVMAGANIADVPTVEQCNPTQSTCVPVFSDPGDASGGTQLYVVALLTGS